jgi:hypothetical protein
VSSSSDGPNRPEALTREAAIGRLRAGLLALSDGEHSMCEVAARLGIFCRGFRRWPDGEFLRVWMRSMGQSTHLDRAQMERLADIWQLTEQLRLRIPIACDALSACGPCRGWNEFSDADLEQFCADVLRESVVVVGSAQKAQVAPGIDGTKGHVDFRPFRRVTIRASSRPS